MPDEVEVVETAAAAATGYITAEWASSDIADIDVRVDFTDGRLDVDVFLEPTADSPYDDDDAAALADDAVLVAADAVDELFAEET